MLGDGVMVRLLWDPDRPVGLGFGAGWGFKGGFAGLGCVWFVFIGVINLIGEGEAEELVNVADDGAGFAFGEFALGIKDLVEGGTGLSAGAL